MFMWLRLPAVADTDDIAAQLVEQNVMVLPGQLASGFTADLILNCLQLTSAIDALCADLHVPKSRCTSSTDFGYFWEMSR